MVGAVAHPVGGDVAGVADGDAVQVRSVTQLIDDLKGGGLLAFQAVGVDGVDERDGLAVADGAGEGEGVVEAAVDGEDAGAVGDGLSELALGDGAGGDEDVDAQAVAGGVGGGGGAGVASGGAEDGLMAGLDRLGDGEDHAAVLERSGGVAGFELEVDGGGGGAALEGGGADEGGIALAEGDAGGGGGEGEVSGVAGQDAAGGGRGGARAGGRGLSHRLRRGRGCSRGVRGFPVLGPRSVAGAASPGSRGGARSPAAWTGAAPRSRRGVR